MNVGRFIGLFSFVLITTNAISGELTSNIGQDAYGIFFGVTYSVPVANSPIKLILGEQGVNTTFLDKHYTSLTSASLGYELKTPIYLYARFSQGIGYLSNKVYGLDDHLQFPTSAAVGFWNGRNKLGVNWTHSSSGHARPTNEGRNFLGVEFGTTF